MQTDEEFGKANNAALVGTTAVVALVGDRQLYIGNCGARRAGTPVGGGRPQTLQPVADTCVSGRGGRVQGMGGRVRSLMPTYQQQPGQRLPPCQGAVQEGDYPGFRVQDAAKPCEDVLSTWATHCPVRKPCAVTRKP